MYIFVRFWVFEKWGRISTKIGGTSLKQYETQNDAVTEFKARFEKLTANTFGAPTFNKKPDRFQLMDIVYDKQKQVLNHLVESKLNPSVYKVMKMICDEKAMEETMLSFNLDTEIPMGKISKEQIKVARNILKELSKLVRKNGSSDEFIEASNRFYTMIPHKFIQESPTILNTTKMIQSKYQILERLSEIEFTYSLLNNTDGTKNPLDSLYHQMNAKVSPLDRKSTEYGTFYCEL